MKSNVSYIVTIFFVFFHHLLTYGQRQIAVDSILLSYSTISDVSVKGIARFPKTQVAETRIINVLKGPNNLQDVKTHNGLLKNVEIKEKIRVISYSLLSGIDTIYATALIIEKEILQAQSALGDRLFGVDNFGTFQNAFICLDVEMKDKHGSTLGKYELNNEINQKPVLQVGQNNYLVKNLYGYMNAPKRLDRIYSGISIQRDTVVVAQMQQTLGKRVWISNNLSQAERQIITSLFCILLSVNES